MIKQQNAGLVFNIQSFSLHDGPGIRDLVFMKGCPLQCKFCCNPESQSPYPELSLKEEHCIGCGECKNACPADAISLSPAGKARIDRIRCTNCGLCAEVCPSEALKLLGKYMSVEEILRIVDEDSPFYWRSGGGITISGGEPTFQADFVHELLKEAKRRYIHTVVETCGHCDWDSLEKVCRYARLVFYDLKHMDSNEHLAFTGVTNNLILANIEKLSSRFPYIPIIVRTTVVPGFNDSIDNIKATVEFLKDISSLEKYQLLPYHSFGEPKYHQLGKKYPLEELKRPIKINLEKLKRIVRDYSKFKKNEVIEAKQDVMY